MRKLRWRVILLLVVINFMSSVLSDLLTTPLLTTPLVAELLRNEQAWVVDIVQMALRVGMTLVIFTLFVILGVREITDPVQKLAKAATQIAEGNYDVELPKSRRRDEIGQLEKSFAVMVKELKSTEYMQKDFVSNVSHEYKTPLAVIGGYAKLLEDDSLPAEERRRYSALIAEETRRLSHMTSSILLLSKLENQGIQPVFARFSLDEQVRQAVLLFLPRLQHKHIELEVEMPDLSVSGNEELLMHVWTNLLDNAVKFTPEGGQITIAAHMQDKEAIVSVSDSGIGMDEATKERVFDRFYQGDSSHSASGSGLGLALAHRVVLLHGGRIAVQSAPGRGATFRVILPEAQ